MDRCGAGNETRAGCWTGSSIPLTTHNPSIKINTAPPRAALPGARATLRDPPPRRGHGVPRRSRPPGPPPLAPARDGGRDDGRCCVGLGVGWFVDWGPGVCLMGAFDLTVYSRTTPPRNHVRHDDDRCAARRSSTRRTSSTGWTTGLPTSTSSPTRVRASVGCRTDSYGVRAPTIDSDDDLTRPPNSRNY